VVRRYLHHDDYGEALLEVALAERVAVPETQLTVLALAEQLHDLAADLEDYADELRRQDDAIQDYLDQFDDVRLAYQRGLAAHVRSVGVAY
jgi:hypothetical protein